MSWAFAIDVHRPQACAILNLPMAKAMAVLKACMRGASGLSGFIPTASRWRPRTNLFLRAIDADGIAPVGLPLGNPLADS